MPDPSRALDRPKKKAKTLTPLHAVTGKIRWATGAYSVMQALPVNYNLQQRNNIRDLAVVICRQEGGNQVLGKHVTEARQMLE